VDATDAARPRHARALARLEGPAPVVFSAQVAREYLAVATRPLGANGLGLTPEYALDNLRAFRTVLRLLPEERPVLPALLELLRVVPCSGRAVFDAAIAATLVAHGVASLLTANPGDFTRFEPRIRVVPL
jgi:predicted nucleic acid-binding protein